MMKLDVRCGKGAVRKLGVLAIACLTGTVTSGQQAERDAGENLVADASFESPVSLGKYWNEMVGAGDPNGGSPAWVEVSNKAAHTGEYCLTMIGEAGTTTWRAATSESIEANAGSRYALSGWMKTDNVRKEGSQFVNCNVFVQFLDGDGNVLPVSGYPVVGTQPLLGTNDWSEVTRMVEAPAGCRTAKVGCFLSCSGQAWFDDVSLVKLPDVNWNQQDSDRFVFFYEGDDSPPGRSIRGHEKNLKELEELLGVKGPERIAYYKYTSNERKGQITGDAGNAHVRDGAIHSIFWGDRHEIVHIVTKPWGDTTALWGEGVAVYLSGAWHGKPVHEAAAQLLKEGKLVPLAEILNTAEFRSHTDLVTYPQSGSFVQYLVDTHGWDKFKQIYAAGGPADSAGHWAEQFQKTYGQSMDEAEASWRAMLGQGQESGVRSQESGGM